MFVSHKSLNGQHLMRDFCRWGYERKRRHLAEEEAWAGTEVAITAYGTILDPVTPLKYLGRVISTVDNNWPAVVRNLRRARKNWAWLTRVLISEGADAQTSGHIYLSVVQSVMLYRLETWVMTPALGGFWVDPTTECPAG